MISFYPYQTRAVRDLAWACFAPALLHTANLDPASGPVTDAAFELTPARRRWLERLDRDALPLTQYLAAPGTTRLGLYFERLWHFFLREDPEVELIAHNLPVTDGGRTLGEFDCLYYCRRRNTHVHLELAIKFYLGVAGGALEGAWVGPNVRDRLDLKLAHLLARQIRLADRPAAQQQLTKLGIGSVQREIALRGYLFQPTGETLPAPAGYNPERTFATWCNPAQLAEKVAAGTAKGFRILNRLEWLAAQCAEQRERMTADDLEPALRARFADRRSPVLVAALDAAGEEYARFFVVHHGWPDNLPPPRYAAGQ